MVLRGIVVGVAIAILAPLSAEASTQRVAVAPVRGKVGRACTRVVRDIAQTIIPLLPWETQEDGELPSTWEELSPWLNAKGHQIGVDIVVLGGTSGSRMLLEAYDLSNVRLIGLQ